jgi:murein DD-endopeptidase MepM/ murein hydrolase activator NlpD
MIVLLILHILYFIVSQPPSFLSDFGDSFLQELENCVYPYSEEKLYPPVDGELMLPFDSIGSVQCGHWCTGSTDYPYYGAPREGNRFHGAVDIYTTGATATDGGGMTVRAIKSGTVIYVIEHFYQRSSTGEVTKAILIDHGSFVACYCEIRGEPNVLGSSLSYTAGATVNGGEIIGYVSGTKQLHFELYTRGTTRRANWYGLEPPESLLDPTLFVNLLYR